MKLIKKLIFLSFCTLTFSCSDNDKAEEPIIYDLSFEEDHYNICSYIGDYIPIIGGSKNYTITSGDESILTAKFEPLTQYDTPSNKTGWISVQTAKKGSTFITVKDNILGQTKTVNITVTKRYLGATINMYIPSVKADSKNVEYEILNDIYDNSSIGERSAIYLVGNEGEIKDNKFYLFKSYEDVFKDEVQSEGHYTFEKNESKEYIILNLTINGKSETRKLLVTNYSDKLSSISSFLNLDLQDPAYPKYPEPYYTLTVEEDLTNLYIDKYNGLTSASLKLKLFLNPYDYVISPDLLK